MLPNTSKRGRLWLRFVAVCFVAQICFFITSAENWAAGEEIVLRPTGPLSIQWSYEESLRACGLDAEFQEVTIFAGVTSQKIVFSLTEENQVAIKKAIRMLDFRETWLQVNITNAKTETDSGGLNTIPYIRRDVEVSEGGCSIVLDFKHPLQPTSDLSAQRSHGHPTDLGIPTRTSIVVEEELQELFRCAELRRAFTSLVREGPPFSCRSKRRLSLKEAMQDEDSPYLFHEQDGMISIWFR